MFPGQLNLDLRIRFSKLQLTQFPLYARIMAAQHAVCKIAEIWSSADMQILMQSFNRWKTRALLVTGPVVTAVYNRSSPKNYALTQQQIACVWRNIFYFQLYSNSITLFIQRLSSAKDKRFPNEATRRTTCEGRKSSANRHETWRHSKH